MEFRARTQDDALEFIDALENSPCFSDVYPTDEGRSTQGEYELTIAAVHDPYCGQAPALPAGHRLRGAITRRGGGRG